MTSLESLVTDLATSQQLKAAGFPQDTALAWYPEHCDDYEAPAPASLWPDEWKRIAEGIPAVCVREEMEDHESLCAAPTAEEILKELARNDYGSDEGWELYQDGGDGGWLLHLGHNEFYDEHGSVSLVLAAAQAWLWWKEQK